MCAFFIIQLVYVTGQNKIQVKIFYPRLILNFLCLLALINIHELGLGDREIENQLRLRKILT